MGALRVSRGRVGKVTVTVEIGGTATPWICCTGVTLQAGVGASAAQFEAPAWRFDQAKDRLRDALVRVWARSDELPDPTGAEPIFVGYLDTSQAELSAENDMISFGAHTIGAYLDRVFVGQTTHQAEVRYRLINPITGARLIHGPLEILRDIIEHMPSLYGGRVELGDTAVLSRSASTAEVEMKFNETPVSEAINMICGLFGDVVVYESFSGFVTKLNFFRINDPSRGSVYLNVSSETSASGLGNVATLSETETSHPCVTRITGYGSKRYFMISCRSGLPENNPEWGDANPLTQLIRDWDPRWEKAVLANPKLASNGNLGYNCTIMANYGAGDILLKIVSGLDIAAGAVLKVSRGGEHMRVLGFTRYQSVDPDTGADSEIVVERGYGGTTALDITDRQVATWLMAGIDRVFRRYRLPAALNGYTKCKDMFLLSGNREIEPQAWRYTTTMDAAKDSILTGIWDALPSRREAKFILDKDYIVFNEPCVAAVWIGIAGSKTVMTYDEAIAGVTFVVESDEWLYHDTGQVGSDEFRHDFAADGMTKAWQRNDLKYCQVTNLGHALGGAEWYCDYFDPVTGGFIENPTAVVYQDDQRVVRAVSRGMLAENNRRARTYAAGIEWHTQAYRLGQRVTVNGLDNYAQAYLTVTGVSWMFASDGDHQTSLTIENVKPPRRKMIVRAKRGLLPPPAGYGRSGWGRMISPTAMVRGGYGPSGLQTEWSEGISKKQQSPVKYIEAESYPISPPGEKWVDKDGVVHGGETGYAQIYRDIEKQGKTTAVLPGDI